MRDIARGLETLQSSAAHSPPSPLSLKTQIVIIFENMDISHISASSTMVAFKTQFVQQVAKQLLIPTTHITVVSIVAGSAVVTILVNNTSGSLRSSTSASVPPSTSGNLHSSGDYSDYSTTHGPATAATPNTAVPLSISSRIAAFVASPSSAFSYNFTKTYNISGLVTASTAAQQILTTSVNHPPPSLTATADKMPPSPPPVLPTTNSISVTAAFGSLGMLVGVSIAVVCVIALAVGLVVVLRRRRRSVIAPADIPLMAPPPLHHLTVIDPAPTSPRPSTLRQPASITDGVRYDGGRLETVAVKDKEDPERVEDLERLKRVEELERVERVARVARVEELERVERVARLKSVEELERLERVARVEELERQERVERVERLQKVQRVERRERRKKATREDKLQKAEQVERVKRVEAVAEAELAATVALAAAECMALEANSLAIAAMAASAHAVNLAATVPTPKKRSTSSRRKRSTLPIISPTQLALAESGAVMMQFPRAGLRDGDCSESRLPSSVQHDLLGPLPFLAQREEAAEVMMPGASQG